MTIRNTTHIAEMIGREARRQAAQRPLQASAWLITQPLSASAPFCGTVDGTDDNPQPTARTVCQSFGAFASEAFALPALQPAHSTDRVTLCVSIAAGLFVGGMLIAEALMRLTA